MKELEAKGHSMAHIDFFNIQYQSIGNWKCFRLLFNFGRGLPQAFRKYIIWMIGMDILEKQEHFRVSDPFFEVSLKQQF